MKKIYSALFLSLGLTTSYAQWEQIPQTARPWTRWWWMGSAVDAANIKTQLQEFNDAGIGGVEIVPIYGAKGAESKFISYLSPQWMEMLDVTVKDAAALDMGVYVSVGTGWPIGGPQVTRQNAATKLILQQYTYNSKEPFSQPIRLDDEKQRDIPGNRLVALMAYNDKNEVLDITSQVDAQGKLNWKAKPGNWRLYAAFIGKTLQKVKRAAPGGEGYTLDHFSSVALKDYLGKYDSAFGKSNHGVKAFYNDSYEVYGANWTPDFFEEFRQRRGYDLRTQLDKLVSKDTSDAIARIKSDYRETMSDLMLFNFSMPFHRWAKAKGSLSLNQAHGSPGNLLDLYAAVDIPETESFGSSHFAGLKRDSADARNVDPDPNMMKFASSAGHAMGHNLVSAETFTWLTEHFKTSLWQCKPEVEQIFLAGINHVFFHGTTYSPKDIRWPGWLFYASVEFTPTNSFWPHLKSMNDYIARCQAILQSGQPDNEVLLYWPVYDAWHDAKGMDMPFKVHDIDSWMYGTAFNDNVKGLQKAGYAVDYVSDRMLAQAGFKNGDLKVSDSGAAGKVLVIPACGKMPVSTFRDILRLAQQGATVVWQAFPKDVPGFKDPEAGRKELKRLTDGLQVTPDANGIGEKKTGKGRIIVAASVEQGLRYAGIQPESMVRTGLKFIRRKLDEGKYYYLVNHSGKDIDTVISLQAAARSVKMMDPQSAEAGWISVSGTENTSSVRVQLKAGQTLFLMTTNKMVRGTPWRYYEASGNNTVLNQGWQLHFKEGGPELPADKKLDKIQDWTVFDDTRSFSGTGVYSQTFDLKTKKEAEYLLQLNGLHESAKVFINDKEAGYFWGNPFELKIGKYLNNGQNTIRIEVANLMANRIRYMDQQKIEWRKYHEINFVNINYKDFDASQWKVMPSGIEGPVVIQELKEM